MKQYTTFTFAPNSVSEVFSIFSSTVPDVTLTNQLKMLFPLFDIIKSQNGFEKVTSVHPPVMDNDTSH